MSLNNRFKNANLESFSCQFSRFLMQLSKFRLVSINFHMIRLCAKDILPDRIRKSTSTGSNFSFPFNEHRDTR